MKKARRAVWAAAAMLAASAAAQAATCPASNEAALLACIAGAASGDTVSIGSPIALTGAPLVVNADITVSGAALGGSLLKRGPAMLRLVSANTFNDVSLEAGTIGLDTSASLTWAAGGQFHMRGGKLLSLNPGSITSNGGFFLFSAEGSTVAAPTGGTLTIQAGFQVSDVVATFGDPANAGTVSILVPGSVGVGTVSSEIHVVAGNFTLDSTVIPATVLPTLMNGLQAVTIDTGAMLTVAAPVDLKALAGGGAISVQGLTIRSGTFAGQVSGPGGLTIPVGSSVTLTGSSSYAGGTRVEGELNLGDGGTSGSLPGGSLITITGNGDFTGTGSRLVVNRSDTFTMPNNFQEGGSLLMVGSGTLRLTGSSTRTFGFTFARSGVLEVANPAFAQGGGSVINEFVMDGGRLHFSATTPLVRLAVKGAASVATAAPGVTVSLLDFQIGTIDAAWVFGDPTNTGTFDITNPSGLAYRTDFVTDFSVNGGTVRVDSSLQDPMRFFRTTTVAAGAVLETAGSFTSAVRNLRGDGKLIVGSRTLLTGPTTFNGRIEGAAELVVNEAATFTGDASAFTGTMTINAPVLAGTGAAGGALGTGPLQVNNTLTLNRSASFALANSTIGGNGMIVKAGSGTLSLPGSYPAFTGALRVDSGIATVTGSLVGPVTNNARLMGTGSVGSIAGTGVVAPGLSPGVLTTGALNLAGGTLEAEINGPTPGIGYDQVAANGPVTLGGALTVTLGYAPAAGDTFRIVDNLGGSPVTGTFAGLPEGALVTGGTSRLRISYAGGTGNDVTLTALAVPSAPTITNVTLPTTASALVTFTPPLSDGMSPILDYTAQCGAATATGAASPLTVSGLPAGPVTCVVRARNAVGFSPDSVPFSITPGRFTFSGATPTGTGILTANLAGGGGSCEFTVDPSLVPLAGDPLSPPAGTAPANVQFPHGLFAFEASGCTAGSTVTVTLVYPQPLPAGTQYWKYGPTAATPAPHWYTVPATIAGNMVTLSIVDGGLGDDDLAANGVVGDPGGPGIFVPPPLPPAAAPAAAYQALWWAGPQESGWGINTTHQGNILFATWFTYDANGEGQWFLMSRAERMGPGVFTGTVYTTRGPAFNAMPFDPKQVVVTEVGTGTFTFSSPTAGTFDYTVNGITQSKVLVRAEFGNAIPECAAGGSPPAIVNYQDTWWNAAESGWGLNITHQGDLIFATWFTYGLDGKAQWLLMSNVRRVGFSDQFTGSIYRARGNPFNTLPWNLGSIETAEVGRVTLTFSGRDQGTFAYTLDGVSQVKDITRQEYASPKATCRFP